MTKDRVIGAKNSLPWRLPADMKWFRQHTLGKPVVMGRKTYESFGARALPDRLNIVVTHDTSYDAGDAVVATSIDDAIQKAGDVDEIMIIGGASFYEQTLSIADKLYLTEVAASIAGDAWFPEYQSDQWRLVKTHSHPADAKNTYPMTFKTFERKHKINLNCA